jgi:hypothetical protein
MLRRSIFGCIETTGCIKKPVRAPFRRGFEMQVGMIRIYGLSFNAAAAATVNVGFACHSFERGVRAKLVVCEAALLTSKDHDVSL